MNRPSTPPSDSTPAPTAGLTVADVARRYRVSPDKIRLWIARGELAAINTATSRCGKPRFVVLPQHLAEFEASRQVSAPCKPSPRRRRQAAIDFFPD